MRTWVWQGALLGCMFTSNWWFPPVYRTLPPAFWMVLIIVVGVLLVWRWVAYFWRRG
jgi:hypothetical protein